MKHYNCESFCYCCYQIYLHLWIRKFSIFEWPGDKLLNHHIIRCISEEYFGNMYFSQIQTSKHCLYKYSLAEFPLSPSKSTVAKMWPLKEMNWNNTKFIQQSSIKGQTFYIKFCHLCSLELIEIKAHIALETKVSWIMWSEVNVC